MQDTKNKMVLTELTGTILRCCFDVMNELGSGFLESVYKNGLIVAMQEKNLSYRPKKGLRLNFEAKKSVYT